MDIKTASINISRAIGRNIKNSAIVAYKVVTAINKTNFDFLCDAYKKGGFNQVILEMKAFRARMSQNVEVLIPDLLAYKEIKDLNKCKTIDVPKIDNPDVSIIIPVYNQFSYTYNCLRSIERFTEGINYEVIIADDVSNDLTTRINEICKNAVVIRNKENQRFLLNCKNAAKHAKGKYILFLNNDTQVQKNWLSSLIELIESDEKIGMVGSKLIYPDGTLQEAGGIIWKDGSGWNYGRNQSPLMPEFSYVHEADFISGAAIMIKKTLWDEIGGFDERFVPAYYEDTDLAFEVRKHGYKVMFQPASIVVHFEGKSNGTDLSSGQKSYQVANAKKFYEKCQDELNKNHFDNGQEVFFARDRSRNQKHILVIDHYIPHFDNDAGGRCTYMYLQQFIRMGMRVTFVGDNFAQDEPYKSILIQQGVEILYGSWYQKHFEEWLSINGKNFDYVYSQRPHITIKYLDMIKKYCPGKFFYFDHDLHHLREQREYEITKDESLLESSKRWKEIEFKIIEAADVVHVVGSFEQEYLHKQFPDKIVRNIPLYIYEEIPNDIPKDFDKRKDILFVGGFGHPPNLDAVMWFNKEIFPKVVEKYPDIKWHIVGNKAPKEVLDLASDNIVIDGFVSDERLQELYKTCRLAVVPLRYGAGVKGKVVEAAYYQLPMITTSIGSEGMPQNYGTMIVEDTSAGIVSSIIDLYQNYERLKAISDNGNRFIKDNFSISSVREVLSKDINV